VYFVGLCCVTLMSFVLWRR